MKKIFLFAHLLLMAAWVQADGNKFEEAMKGALAILDSAKTPAEMMDAANRFERIGNAEKKEWLPYYYAALIYTRIAPTQESPEKIDEMLDKAQAFADKADEIEKDNSEIYTLKGLILGSRIMVDPMKRGPVYGMQSSQMYLKATNLDPKNPRPEYLRGMGLLFTPEQFGGGRLKALEVLQSAMTKYESFEPKSEIYPNWGKESCAEAAKKAEDPNFKAW